MIWGNYLLGHCNLRWSPRQPRCSQSPCAFRMASPSCHSGSLPGFHYTFLWCNLHSLSVISCFSLFAACWKIADLKVVRAALRQSAFSKLEEKDLRVSVYLGFSWPHRALLFVMLKWARSSPVLSSSVLSLILVLLVPGSFAQSPPARTCKRVGCSGTGEGSPCCPLLLSCSRHYPTFSLGFSLFSQQLLKIDTWGDSLEHRPYLEVPREATGNKFPWHYLCTVIT